MTGFIQLHNGTYISLAAIREVRRSGKQFVVEYLDGTTRSYNEQISSRALDAVSCQLVPAAAGWQLASWWGQSQVAYEAVVAFRIGPYGEVEPITVGLIGSDRHTALVDQQGRFHDLHGDGGIYDDEAEFLAAMKERDAEQTPKDAAQ
jgi:hypothetical protein